MIHRTYVDMRQERHRDYPFKDEREINLDDMYRDRNEPYHRVSIPRPARFSNQFDPMMDFATHDIVMCKMEFQTLVDTDDCRYVMKSHAMVPEHIARDIEGLREELSKVREESARMKKELDSLRPPKVKEPKASVPVVQEENHFDDNLFVLENE